MLLWRWILVAHAEPCEATATYVVDGEGRASCLYDDLTLAPADIVAACAIRELGQRGARRNRTLFASADFAEIGTDASCPNGMPAVESRSGRRYCVSSDHELPLAAGLDAVCSVLSDGQLGYAWDLCPAGATYSTNCDDTAYCVFDVVLPVDGADAYCDYLDLGYFGYSFADADAAHVCPDGMRRSDNGAGSAFCLSDVPAPAPVGIASYCQYLEEGYLGSSWDISGEPLPESCGAP